MRCKSMKFWGMHIVWSSHLEIIRLINFNSTLHLTCYLEHKSNKPTRAVDVASKNIFSYVGESHIST